MPSEQAEYISGILPGGSVLGNNTFLKGRNKANDADISTLKVDATDDTVLNADTGDVIKFSVANTPIAVLGSLDASGFAKMAVVGDITAGANTVYSATTGGPNLAAGVVVTPVATATVPAGGISGRVSIIATAAPTANYISLPATPIAGAEYSVANRSANPVVLVPGGASTLTNGATFSCAAGKLCKCLATGAAELSCQ